MHRGQHQVTGQRRLHRDLGGFAVADLAHHDLVRIVPQHRTQAAREGEALLLVHRNLQHARQLVLDRVFDGDDLVEAVVDFTDGGVQRGGLAGAGRPGHQQHAVGLGRQLAHGGTRDVVKAQTFQRQRLQLFGQVFLVQHPQHRVFAMHAGHDRHPKIDVAAGVSHLEAPVLRHAALGNVQFGQHLDAGNHLLGGIGAGDLADAHHHAIDPVLHLHAGRHRFKVNVGRTLLERVIERGIDHPHHRAGVVGDARQRKYLGRTAAGLCILVEQAGGGALALLETGKRGGNVIAGGQTQIETVVQRGGQPVLQRQIVGVGHHRDALAGGILGHHHRTRQRLGKADAAQRHRQRVQISAAQRRQAKPRRHAVAHVLRRRGREVDQRLHDRAAAGTPTGTRQQVRRNVRMRQCAHCRLSASWKMGRYMSTTTPPMARPITSMSSGPNNRVARSSQRVISSS